MRTLWLASAAFIVSTHFASAQPATPAPAPTGAPNAPTETSPGMSPGNTASPTATPMTPPSNSGAMSPGATSNGSMSNGSMSNGTMSPGATSNGAMSNGSMSNGSAMSPNASHHKMPANASAAKYLQIAQSAIDHHNKARADEALSRAETRLLTRAVPQSSATSPDESPAITAITQARQALKAGDFKQASAETNTAIQQEQASGGPGNMGSMPAKSPNGMTQ
jgi:hypothetical protein